jgi:hypothetical protein
MAALPDTEPFEGPVQPQPYGAETTLYEYMLDTQRLIADTSQTYLNPEDLIAYINKARREVAMRSQSIRILPPVQGSITQLQLVRAGANYVDPVVHISWPDAPSGQLPNPRGVRATATATAGANGEITGVTLTNGGDGYFRPQVRIYDRDEFNINWADPPWGWWPGEPPDEDDAIVLAQTQPVLKTQGFQEVYPFANVPLDRFPGVKAIFAVKGVSFIYMNYRYSIPVFSFTDYQAYVRIYPQQYLYVPTAGAQYGQGVNGSLYLYPIPSDFYAMEWDCFALPNDLETDDDFEAIPQPWCDCVSLFAAHRAYLGMQNNNAAQYYLSLYDDMCRRYSAYARPGRKINPYGRWAAFT